jgi:hypothetical protein
MGARDVVVGCEIEISHEMSQEDAVVEVIERIIV